MVCDTIRLHRIPNNYITLQKMRERMQLDLLLRPMSNTVLRLFWFGIWNSMFQDYPMRRGYCFYSSFKLLVLTVNNGTAQFKVLHLIRLRWHYIRFRPFPLQLLSTFANKANNNFPNVLLALCVHFSGLPVWLLCTPHISLWHIVCISVWSDRIFRYT